LNAAIPPFALLALLPSFKKDAINISTASLSCGPQGEETVMTYETILYDVDGPVLTITLNRPEKLNAWREVDMMVEMLDAFDRLDADDNIRAVIITGAGRAFCAGADMSRGAESFDRKVYRNKPEMSENDEAVRDGGGKLVLRMYESLKPVIAAVNGPAVGIGATMLLPMDFRLASTTARFGFVFSRRGMINEGCSSFFLPRVVGVSKALEWAMTGRVFDAKEALEGGLVRSLHEPEALLPAARTLALEIAENAAPVSVAIIRQHIWKGLGFSHPMEAHRVESKMFFLRGQQDDSREGVKSFMEKRLPQFPNKVSSDMPRNFPWWKTPAY
jgi:enoyl-CoA hydratase/carnithine racemase